MARKTTGKPAAQQKSGASKGARRAVSSPARKSGGSTGGRQKRTSRRQGSPISAADALMGLLQSPLVADIIAAGATAGLAAMAQRGLSRRREGDSSRAALKSAARAAATAMAARLTEEFDEIMKGSKGGPAGKEA